jgi:FkbM family methyltransferase
MIASTHIEIDHLLVEGVAGATERERTSFDRLTHPFNRSLVLFGAGNLGRTIARELRGTDVEILAFTDNNPNLWGQNVEGLQVLSPAAAAARFGTSASFVVSVWGVGSRDRMATRVQQLRQLGCRVVVPFQILFWKYSDMFLPFHAIDLPSRALAEADLIAAAYELWTDEFSRREFVAQLKWRLAADFDSMADPVSEEIYFPTDLFTLGSREFFVDCGAFDGDTVAAFLKAVSGEFTRILAFEPDPVNFQKLSAQVGNLPRDVSRRIELRQAATGAATGRVAFAALGTDGSSIGSGDAEAECVALDTVFPSGLPPTLVKMDIEGSELEALNGCRTTIANHQPALAICAYHRQADLWHIPLLIHSIHARYRLAVRPHRIEGWDVVCYASGDSTS